MSNPSDGSKTDATDTKSDQPSTSPPPRRISFASSTKPAKTSQSSVAASSSKGTTSNFEATRLAKQRDEGQTVTIGTPSDVGFTYLQDLKDDDALEVPQESTKAVGSGWVDRDWIWKSGSMA
ncbi:hypothetical protein EHS25_003810 [Saitozyma podzolica]|uniref:Uncharacterized protein n=1 Tax=Saitozyma podzolica TaxID=1890683 RepID=A0A427Y3L1_9TREE|nr:hypothetical protein EHS25_003810 [Saitozyma podzolica]